MFVQAVVVHICHPIPARCLLQIYIPQNSRLEIVCRYITIFHINFILRPYFISYSYKDIHQLCKILLFYSNRTANFVCGRWTAVTNYIGGVCMAACLSRVTRAMDVFRRLTAHIANTYSFTFQSLIQCPYHGQISPLIIHTVIYSVIKLLFWPLTIAPNLRRKLIKYDVIFYRVSVNYLLSDTIKPVSFYIYPYYMLYR